MTWSAATSLTSDDFGLNAGHLGAQFKQPGGHQRNGAVLLSMRRIEAEGSTKVVGRDGRGLANGNDLHGVSFVSRSPLLPASLATSRTVHDGCRSALQGRESICKTVKGAA